MLKQTSYFQQRYPVEQRISMSERIRERFPDRVPVILEPIKSLPNGSLFPNNKYAVPQQCLVSALSEIVTGKLGCNTKLYIRLENYPPGWSNWLLSYVYDTSLIPAPANMKLLEMYTLYKHLDGLLYIAYTIEK